jgi:MarR family transcriptional regulator, 2-MHQ and catechol-resistance regulon repressor
VKVTELIWLGQQLSRVGRTEAVRNAPGVAIAELIVMGDLIDNTPSSITEIAERTGYAQSRVSTAVAQIVERGWAETRSDPEDGRRTVVVVPDEMRAASRAYQQTSQPRPFEEILANVDPSRRPAIMEALQELHDALRQGSSSVVVEDGD